MKTKQREAIVKHGEHLLKIFPNALEQDPVRLCKKLRLLEGRAALIGARLCNGPEFAGGYEEADRLADAILAAANRLLGNIESDVVPVFINRDPRGHALKIRESWMLTSGAQLHRDWGGYGIIAPEIE